MKDTKHTEENQPVSIRSCLDDADPDTCEEALGDVLTRSIGRIFILADCGAPIVPIHVDFPDVVYIAEEHGELYIGKSRICHLGIRL